MDSHEAVTLKDWIEQGNVAGFTLAVIVEGNVITVVDAVPAHTTWYDEKEDHVHMGKMFASGRLESTKMGKEYWADSRHMAQWATFQLGPASLTITRKWLNKEEGSE